MKESELHGMFARFGKILECRIAVDRETGRGKGFGFVTMDSLAAATQAMKELAGSMFSDGRVCNIEISGSKSQAPHKKSAPTEGNTVPSADLQTTGIKRKHSYMIESADERRDASRDR